MPVETDREANFRFACRAGNDLGAVMAPLVVQRQWAVGGIGQQSAIAIIRLYVLLALFLARKEGMHHWFEDLLRRECLCLPPVRVIENDWRGSTDKISYSQ